MKERSIPETPEPVAPGSSPESHRHSATSFDEIDIGEQRGPTSDGNPSPPQDGGG
jgi:hypothetical protein